MTKKHFIISILLFCIVPMSVWGNRKDSVWNVWSNEKMPVMERSKAMAEFIEKHYSMTGNDSALYFIDLLFKLSDEKNSVDAKAIGLYLKGEYYSFQDDYVTAIDYLEQALKLFKNISDKEFEVYCLKSLGTICTKIEEFDKAEFYFNKNLEINEILRDTVEIGSTLMNLGVFYEYQGLLEKAISYTLKAELLFNKIKLPKGIARAQINLASYYSSDPINDYNKALKYAKQAIEYINANETPYIICATKQVLGNIFYNKGDYDSAIKYCNEGLFSAENAGFLWEKKNALVIIYQSYKALGDTNKAHIHLEKLITVEDSLNIVKTSKKIQEIGFKEQQLSDSLKNVNDQVKVKKQHQHEIQGKNIFQNQLIFIGGISILLILIVSVRLWRAKKSKEAIIVKKEAAQKALHNTLNSLKEKLILESKTNEELKRKLTSSNLSVEDSEYVKNKVGHENNWLVFMTDFNREYNGLLDKLTEKYSALTYTDKCIIILTMLGTPNKEIQSLMAISYSGVKKAKSRVRDKLGLRKVPEIGPFLHQFMQKHG